MTAARSPAVLAEGIGFTEGPLITRDGRLLVVALSRGLVVEIDLQRGGVRGTVEVGGGPNGLAETDDGAVWVAQNAGAVTSSRSSRPTRPGLQRIVGGTVLDLPVPGTRAPNDLVVGPDGRLWFTDPGPPGDTDHGRLLALDPATGESETLLDEQDFPNGLAFDRDTATLWLAHTEEERIRRHRWEDGRLRPLDTGPRLPDGGPDGLALDARGLLYAAAPAADAVFVYTPSGELHERLDLGERTFPTNVCLAGEQLVVTAARGGRVLVVPAVAG
ncbi:SMP-30/gluconolactonase/LRE family protein [Actinomycetospora rhizophila]|uniref:SMP-30/gluconolactonase/LRE family protein n=1 Tax=Actinomycetospora rhizophila TaxID=1416876 RepID=A0ABV9ZU45_9PSEU